LFFLKTTSIPGTATAMLLLDLPPELLQLILYQTTTPSYLQTAFSCHTLFSIASTCREVVLHHLNKTPGLTGGLESRSTIDLFNILRKRAAAHLYGANFCADQTTYTLGEYDVIDVRASALGSSSDPDVALVKKGGSGVHIYHASSEGGGITFRGRLEAPYSRPGKVEVFKVVLGENNLVSVLQRFTPTSTDENFEGDGNEHLFVKQAMQPFRTQGIHLVHYNLAGLEPAVTFYAFPDHPDHYPLAVAVANQFRVAISWQHSRRKDIHEVVFYTAVDNPDETLSINRTLFPPMPLEKFTPVTFTLSD
jgi:hypothetical protein